MRFVKYHGLGNDFIVLDSAAEITAELAVRLCQRGFSIGADGLMRVAPPTSPGADVTMDLVNSDGSLPEMCGNGIRCLVKHAVDALGLTRNPLVVDTPAGALACRWTPDADGKVASVRVAMGRPRFSPAEIPLDPHHTRPGADGKVASVRVAMGRPRFSPAEIPLDPHHTRPGAAGQVAVRLGEREFEGVAVNTGNPHFAVFGDASRATALAFGPSLEVHPAFPAKANIEFVAVIDDGRDGTAPRLRVTVWERGCGLTHACGTGATAATAAALRLGYIAHGRDVEVELPGGTLVITIAPDFAEAFMEGPVALAFTGETQP